MRHLLQIVSLLRRSKMFIGNKDCKNIALLWERHVFKLTDAINILLLWSKTSRIVGWF